MNQPQQQYAGQPRRTGTYGSHNDELHMGSGMSPHGQQQHSAQTGATQQHGPLSPREYSSSGAPHINLEQPPSNAPPTQNYQAGSAVPNVLQPGGLSGRLPVSSPGATQPLSDFSTPQKPSVNLSHTYSRSSPAAPYEGGSQRNVSSTPLGLADIRPRADSNLSDGVAGGAQYELANSQPGTSNYIAPWALYAFDWCKWPPHGNGAGKLALGSYLEDGHNYIQILDSQYVPAPADSYVPGSSKYSMEFTKIAEATHSFPVTRLLWEPPSSQKQSTDLLATSGDHLRLWSLPSDAPTPQNSSITGKSGRDAPTTKLTPLALLSNSKTPDHTAPLTSLDWNTVSPSLIITSSIDTTCTIWDIPSLTAKTQLIAHDKEVYDVRFCANSVDVFVSCGADGSVRMFDLRSLEHSTIIYEPTGKEERGTNGGRMSPTLAQQTMSNPPPLLRLATSPHDTQYLATFAQDSNVIRILDVRQPGHAILELQGHGGAVNSVEWSPHRRGTLASGGDDCQVLIWDILDQLPAANGASQPRAPQSPVASWQCDYEVGNLGWLPRPASNEYGDWLGVSAGRGVWGVNL